MAMVAKCIVMVMLIQTLNASKAPAQAAGGFTLKDSLTAYTGRMVTEIKYHGNKINSIEFFNGGDFVNISAKSLDSLNKEINKKKRKSLKIDSLLKAAYQTEAFLLERQQHFVSTLSSYIGEKVNRYQTGGTILTSITVFRDNATKVLNGDAIKALFGSAEQRTGYKLQPFIEKYIYYESILLEEKRRFY